MADKEKELAAEFLLEEYKELNNTLHINEERGEKRLEFFVTISTIVLGATGFIITKFGEIKDEFKLLLNLVLIFLLAGLIIVGIITQKRLKKRNEITDGLKKDLTRIRNIYKRKIDPDNEILPPDYDAFKNPVHPTKNSRKFTSLFHIAIVINCVMIGTFVAFVSHAVGLEASAIIWLSVATTLFAIMAFSIAFRKKEEDKKDCNRVGALVYKLENNERLYLLVTSSTDPSCWVLPKGHLNVNEPLAFGAVREVLEEAGVAAFVEEPVGKLFFMHKGKEVIVCYFLMRLVKEVNESTEGRNKLWLPKKEAVEKLSFPELKNFVSRYA